MNTKLAGLIGGWREPSPPPYYMKYCDATILMRRGFDKLGEEALDKTVAKISGKHVPAKQRYPASMAADLISITLYYSTAALNPPVRYLPELSWAQPPALAR